MEEHQKIEKFAIQKNTKNGEIKFLKEIIILVRNVIKLDINYMHIILNRLVNFLSYDLN